MKKLCLSLGCAAVLLLTSFALSGAASAETCFNCAKDSASSCTGKQQCRGTRKECRQKGCRITGTASCSTAANVKKCEAPRRPNFDRFASYPVSETCLMCARDSTGRCAGASQCRGTRKECRARGCKITGTASCSKAANVKICRVSKGSRAQTPVPWVPRAFSRTSTHSDVHPLRVP